MIRKSIMADDILKVTQESKDCTICPDTVSITKHTIAKSHSKSCLMVFVRFYTILITTFINVKAEQIRILDAYTVNF